MNGVFHGRLLSACLLGAGILLVYGCADERRRNDDWYEYSSDLESREKDFVANQVAAGVDPVEASRNWALKYAIERTEGRDRLPTLGAGELDGSAAAGSEEDPNRFAPRPPSR